MNFIHLKYTINCFMDLSISKSTILKKHIALPQDHGSWVFLFSPLLIGLFAGGSWNLAGLWMSVGAIAAFLIRQPVTIAVKAYSGRRSRRDLPAAGFWMGLYGVLGLLALAQLITLGYTFLLVVALPGLPVFAWHLYLVSRRAERRQMAVELVGTGVLALAAPAAYWVGVGSPDPLGWWLFFLTWFQSAASIVYAYLRLEQRSLEEVPPMPARLQMGRRALLYTSFNLAVVIGLSLAGVLPPLLPLAFAVQWLETVWGTLFRPAAGYKPTTIGFRQLAVSAAFTAVFILTWQMP